MADSNERALAIVAVSAILPDAPDVTSFWNNVKDGRYSVSEVSPDRWDPAFYYDPDPAAPEKTYSKIGGWVRDWEWDPMAWRLPIPPKVADAMDENQRWAVACARSLLLDYGHPERALDFERTAVVVGTAMAGDRHYLTSLPVFFPEYAAALAQAPSFCALPEHVREAIVRESHARMAERLPSITEDSMPGELANCIPGRIANVFDFHGPNFVCDAACASALAAIDAAHDGLLGGQYDAVLVGGVDRNMGPAPFVKFSKIGALSATGTRPYADGADGFVMGEGAAFFLLKRLADAEANGDHIYAVLRGIGGSSDGRGKGITAPNPVGQRLAIERAWRSAGLSPASATLVEGHGTSTRVGDVVEVDTLSDVFGRAGASPGSIALGSVKSNIGHLKGAAGAAGLLKTVMALDERVLPPSLHFAKPNPKIDFAQSPFTVNTECKPWDAPEDGVRRAGVSAFGFGGTNFHLVLEEYIPGRSTTRRRAQSAVPEALHETAHDTGMGASDLESPLRGAIVLGAPSSSALYAALDQVLAEARKGRAPVPAPPREAALRAPERLAIDYGDAEELATKAGRARKIFEAPEASQPAMWRALRAQGIFRGRGEAPKIAFLYTGQGSQYANMLDALRRSEPLVSETFEEADRVMSPLLGRPLSELLFVDTDDARAVEAAEAELKRTEITQPAVLTIDHALTRLLESYGVVPDFVMGHSLGEYGALVAARALPFADALEAVSARGRGMANLSIEDNGRMAAVFAPLEEIERILDTVEGNVVIANINSTGQAVIGGATEAVERAMAVLSEAGHKVVQLPVSHAFHTSIVAPASDPLRQTLERLALAPPQVPVVSNVTGRPYPMGPNAVPEMLDLLTAQVSSTVQFVKGLRCLYDQGARVFVEVGPKRALQGFAADVLGGHDDVVTLFTNHPKQGDATAFNQALCGIYAAGLGVGRREEQPVQTQVSPAPMQTAHSATPASAPDIPYGRTAPEDRYAQLGHLFEEFVQRGAALLQGGGSTRTSEPPVVMGAALGLPGREHVFDDHNVQQILDGEQEIDVIPTHFRNAIVDKHVTRLVKSGGGGPHFEPIESSADVIKLAARAGEFDLEAEFGVSADRLPALDITTQLAIAAGLEAMRDAGLPLVRHYRTTSKGTRLPDRWMLPEPLRDDTGVIFASAFPGYDAFAQELTRYGEDHGRLSQLETLRSLRARAEEDGAASHVLRDELDRRIHELEEEQAERGYAFDRRFLFRVLPMGHSQFAEYIGARGPNTQINAACASTTQAFAIAEDWIASGRCRRVIVIAADDVTTDHLLEWIGAGFLASGAAATDDIVEEAALPFDRRRHGMILGMGAVGVVLEHPEAARERGLRPICEVLSTVTANSAFHGTRLDVTHIADVMERIVSQAEARFGLDRLAIARELLFVSHETYTPARGGSASAEVESLRRVFGSAAEQIVVANTKGLTGHPMGAGIEDAVAIKALETGVVPPVPNYREPDPELGILHLSKGGAYPIRYALRLGAGFGSQISMTLMRWIATPDGTRPPSDALGFESRLADPVAWQSWLKAVSGNATAEVEVAQRTLRVIDRGPASRVEGAAAPSTPTSSASVPVAPVPEHDPVKPAAPAATPTSAPEAPAPATTSEDDEDAAIREAVLGIVAAKTGYPVDMLEMDLDLEADLGIDTVKQAETFAAIREAYDIPFDENLQLRDYPTLAHAVGFVRERRPSGSGAPTPAASEEDVEGTSDDVPRGSATEPLHWLEGDLDAAQDFPRRVPIAVLRPPISLCDETGIRLDASARVVVMPDRGGVAEALRSRLEARDVEVLTLAQTTSREAFVQQIEAWRSDGPIRGVYWLPGLDDPDDPLTLELAEWRMALELRVKRLSMLSRTLHAELANADRFLIAATRLGGCHGLDPAGARAPLGGGVTGFTKAIAREWPESLVKAVDFSEDAGPDSIADAIVQETLHDSGAVELGRLKEDRIAVTLAHEPADDGQPGMTLDPDSVFVVTGAAGSIVSAIVADLTRAARGGRFHLLDVAPEPDPSDPELGLFESDREALKRRLFERLRGAGERGTPVQVERELARVERAHDAAVALRAVAQAGGTAHYHAVDLTHADSVAKVVDEIRAADDRIDVLIHAAGLERSHQLPDKPVEEFDFVFDVKSDGWFNLLHELADTPIGATIAFSSIAGRFGNAGQTDYAAANDLLCKCSSRLHADRSDTRAITIDWTAWAQIGMASRGSIPETMQRAGIDMLPPAAGIAVVRRELTMGARSGEVLIAGALGILEQERREASGLAVGSIDAEGVMIGAIERMSLRNGLEVRTVLDPKQHPFLDHHRIDGTAVLPGVMGIEAFAEVAALWSRICDEAWRPVCAEDVEFLAPFKFYRDEPREFELSARLQREGVDIIADCRLVGRRTLRGSSEPQVTEHFRARIRLAREPLRLKARATPEKPAGEVLERDDIYRVYFHGPAYQVLEAAWREGDASIGRLAARLPDALAPGSSPLVTRPRLLELCFQTAGVREIGDMGRMGLPAHIARVEWFETPEPDRDGLYARVTSGREGEHDAVVLDAGGRPLLRMQGYTTTALPADVPADLRAPLRTAMS